MYDHLERKLLYFGGAAIGAFLSLPLAFQTVLGLQCIDLVAGLIVAVMRRSVEPRRMLLGIGKKVIALLLIGAVALFARGVGKEYGFDASFSVSAISIAYCVYELISIVRNAHRARVPVPTWLVEKLAGVERKLSSSTANESAS